MEGSYEKRLYEFFTGLDRSLFIDNEYSKYAHFNNALPIGHEQTISQPTLVYAMTQKLKVKKDSKVLEIGTGSGYQTAFLAEFAREVYTVERIEELSLKAQESLKRLGYENIRFRIGDGSEGWAEHAPYDRIMVTAAAGKLPDRLIAQLAPAGRMIIPIGEKGLQDLMLITRDENGGVKEKFLENVIFVEMKGKYGWQS
jgi:protein-L-isoaspartate(D-aspartate) O-methyltransferase